MKLERKKPGGLWRSPDLDLRLRPEAAVQGEDRRAQQRAVQREGGTGEVRNVFGRELCLDLAGAERGDVLGLEGTERLGSGRG